MNEKNISEPLWEFIPLAEYSVPSLPTTSAVKTSWQSFKSFFGSQKEEDAPAKKEKDLYSLSQSELDRIAPFFSWEEVATALGENLRDWLDTKSPETPVKILVGQVFCGHAEITTLLGQWRKALLVSPPPSEEILAANTAWLDAWPAKEKFWVLPCLEHCYLRHANGLNLVRSFLQKAFSGQLGKGLIACDSWAWAYLQRIFPAIQTPALTLKDFNAGKLQRLLSGSTRAEQKKNIRFLNAMNGEEIIDSWPDQKKTAFEFTNLAALSRGNAAIALYNWRSRLRLEADPAAEIALENQPEQTLMSHLEKCIWVRAFAAEPNLPEKNIEEHLLVLHALLLHGGMSAQLLPDVLPFSKNHCQEALLRLAQSEIVQKYGDRWHITPEAYSRVRRLLFKRDYLVDQF